MTSATAPTRHPGRLSRRRVRPGAEDPGSSGHRGHHAALYPQLEANYFRNQAAQLQIPVYLVQGRHEARGRAVLAQEWFDTIDAPTKKWIEFAQSGHRPLFEEPDRFAEVMRSVLDDVR